MKIELIKNDGCGWFYNEICELTYTQKQYDYVLKYLYFDKLDKRWWISFNNKETEEWFYKTYRGYDWLEHIYIKIKTPERCEWLKKNWGKGVFKILVNYPDKQKLKTVVNRVINIELKRIK